MNVATVTGVGPAGQPVSDVDTATVTAEQGPAISLTKVADPTTFAEVGTPIVYTYTVTNNGNVTVSSIALDDDQLGAITCPRTTLAPTESMTCTATHVTTRADLDAGEIVNVATVTGVGPGGETVTDSDDATVVGVEVAGEQAGSHPHSQQGSQPAGPANPPASVPTTVDSGLADTQHATGAGHEPWPWLLLVAGGLLGALSLVGARRRDPE